MPLRLQDNCHDDEEEGGSSASGFQQHGAAEDQVFMEEEDRLSRTRRNRSCPLTRSYVSRELQCDRDPLCLDHAVGLRSQEAKADDVEHTRVPLFTSTVQQSSLATIPALLWLAVVQCIFKLMGRRKAVQQRPVQLMLQAPSLLAPGHKPENTAAPPKVPIDVRCRRKRTKGPKARASASKRAAGRRDAANPRASESIRAIMPEEATSHPAKTKSVDHVQSAAEKKKARRHDQVEAESASGRQDEERAERSRAGCQQRADTETRRIMRSEKNAEEGGKRAKRPAFVEAETGGDEASPVTGAATALEFPSPRKSRRLVANAAAAEGGGGAGRRAREGVVRDGVDRGESSMASCPSDGFQLLSPSASRIVTRYPPQLMQELRAKITSRRAGGVGVEGVEEGAFEGVPGRGCGETEQESKGLVATIYTQRPGDLKNLFVRNLRKTHNDDVVYVAQTALERPCGGPFQLEYVGVLGDGTFGIVSAVRHPVSRREYALKTLRKGMNREARFSAIVEMTVLARLSLAPHPNVISAVAIDDSQLNTMPTLLPKADCDFFTVLTTGSWAMSELLRCLQQVGAGAQHMHGHGLVHGDIKPHNILMFRGEGEGGRSVPQLADFGTARELGEERSPMMGTLGYMPLECMRGPMATTSSQDVFALAAIALLACAASSKARSNMFGHPDLYTSEELADKDRLSATPPPEDISDRLFAFEWAVTMRTLEDGSFEKMLQTQNLSEDLGSRDSVSVCLPLFLQKETARRPGIESFRAVMDNLAKEAAKKEAEVEARSNSLWESRALFHNGDENDDYCFFY